jgi:hypothetical protein
MEKFGVFGKIKSLKLCQNQYGQYGFICFQDPEAEDKFECFRLAAAAQKAMDKLKVGTYTDPQSGELKDQFLYVQFYVSKDKRQNDKQV